MDQGFFISESFDLREYDDDLLASVTTENGPEGRGAYFDGVIQVPVFLADAGRQFLEGQIFAYGSDFRGAYRTLNSVQCPDEITIAAPEMQLPVISDLTNELQPLLARILPWRFRRCIYQLRIYEPGYKGHPEHVDYAPGYTISGNQAVRRGVTSVSFSLPISWNAGEAPAFKLRWNNEEIIQNRPGSLVIFGPRVLHSHPSAPSLSAMYAWLIGQAFYEFDVHD
jgi:hypothetical protein